MKIMYILPGVIGKTELGIEELERRQGILRSWAFPGTEVDIVSIDSGPATIESMYEEYISVPGSARRVKEARDKGYDAAIVGCFGDPGLDALRETSDVLVVGPSAATMSMATLLCNRFSIVTVAPGLVAGLKRVAWETGVIDKLSSVRSVDLSVVEVNKDREGTLTRIVRECRSALESDGAEVLILGCMSMGFLDVSENLSRELGVPVLNPVKTALKVTEGFAALDLHHSKRAYVLPKKMQKGTSLDDLFVK